MAPGTARLLALALVADPEPVSDAHSDGILDAALAVAGASGIRHLTMDDVARRAGVSRMTVYRRFGGKDALVDALAVRECRRCLAQIAASIDPTATIDVRLAALAAATLRLIREHPLLARLARFEPEDLLLELTRDDSSVFRLVTEFLMAQIEPAQESGELVRGDPALLAEMAVRLGASFVLMPDSALPLGDEAATRRALRSLIAPFVRRAP
ncbi:MAG TPA: helix-turn-helix domain-containing protein [Solirubrobacteraceae bacterium]|jgi:AcrR family transcriptional regulator|nr:helix-turn-helix domain-containing protein [Solirubrobacteraceae bacterium]